MNRLLRWAFLCIDACFVPGLVLSLGGVAKGEPSEAGRFQAHVAYLASDELEGRGVGSKGIELAAEYIAGEFKRIGLEPAGENKSYFQTFPITLHRTLTGNSRLAFSGDATERKLSRDFVPFSFSSEEAFEAETVFCGYGIVAADKQRDDFVHVDTQGKVVILFRGEPVSWADADGNSTTHAMFRNKIYNAKDRGAVAVLMVNQRPAEGETEELTEFTAESAEAYGIPAFHVSRSMAEAMLDSAGVGSLDALQGKLDGGAYASAAMPTVKVSGQAVFQKNAADTRNVIGIFRGTGPRADEVVIIGAHYDHLGIQKPMMRKFKAGQLVKDASVPQIHNGADDNASGTGGLIEIARKFAKGPPPGRSILFIAFTAEESGLHGSKYYVEHPTVPLAKTAAMLNLDMIGRMPSDTDKVHVFGVECGREFGPLVEKAGTAAGLSIATTGDPGGRSDHATFVRQQIPSLHFFSGQHPDYHKPTDDADKINAQGGVKIASLVHAIAGDIAALNARPVFAEVKTTSSDQPTGTPTYRVVMGIAPGYGDDGKPGMAVEAVTPEGPADVAGLKAGDRILRIGSKKVANIYDYMAATRGNKPGDVVEVVVLREEIEVALKVKLAPAK